MSVFEKIKPPSRFVGLHAHSGVGSPYDGLGYPSQHIDFVLSNEMNAWALTDHGNGNGLAHAHSHAKKLKKQGVDYRQLYGVEFYFVPSLDVWKTQYEAHREEVRFARSEKKLKEKIDIDSEDEVGLIVENEEETKNIDETKEYPEWKRRYHLVVFAKSKKGLENLFTLVKKSYVDGFYRFPRIDFKMLKQYGEGLVVSTACIGGIGASIAIRGEALKKDFNEIQRELQNVTDKFVDAVGLDNFNLEIQFNKLGMQHTTNKHLIALSDTTGIPLIATADSHYYGRDKWEARELYRKLGRMGARGGKQEILPAFDELKCELYPKNASQMWDEFKIHYPEYDFYKGNEEKVKAAIERTYDIAWDQCDELWFDTSMKLFDFGTPDNSAAKQLNTLVQEGLVNEGLDKNKIYVDRANEELDIIKKLGFENYFITQYKVLQRAKDKTLIGAGRGSAAGSLVCYLLEIIDADPIKYDLLFERMLHLSKAGLPDIDIDAADRDILIDASRELFGDDAVVPVSNFNTLKLKSLVKDVAKFYGVSFVEVNKMTNPLEGEVMRQAMGDHEERSTYVLTHDDCMKYSKNYKDFMEKYPKVKEHVQNLFMESRSIGRHAGGVILCPDLEKSMPVIKVRGELQTPWSEGMNFRHLEENGFLKFDFLGLATLKMIEDCISLILKNSGQKDVTFKDITNFYNDKLNCRYNELDDQKVWEYVYHKGHFTQVFQLTQDGARKFCMKAKPRSVEDLSAVTAIYRPGPLKMNVHRKYVKTKRALEEKGIEVEYDHPILKEILSDSLGYTIYQENFMMIAQKLCGFNKAESDKMRKTLVKKSLDQNDKKIKEREVLKERFISGAIDLSGMTKHKAEKLYETIEAFSNYGFNKSHSICYSIDSYYSAWLHTHYEKEWLATCLQTWNGSPKFGKIVAEIKSFGYTILPPDINTSSEVWVFSEERNGFVPPLTAIKGVGSAAVYEIMRRRPFKSLDGLLFDENEKWAPSKMNKTSFDSLCKVEAFGSLEELSSGKIANHCQLHEIIIGSYPSLKKGKYGLTKSALKRARAERGEVQPLLDEKIIESSDLPDWQRSTKIAHSIALLSNVDDDLLFPPTIMKKIKKANVQSIADITGNNKGIAWFCIQEINEKVTKNGKVFYKMKVVDDNSNSSWLRVWTKFKVLPELYTMWLAEIASTADWGCSTSSYKMKQLAV
tara:strand:+ start:696 stop:4268 length:3573 start_codon:yes stop_codon:yes gene_type:complete